MDFAPRRPDFWYRGTALASSNRVSTSLGPILVLLPFHRLFLFHRLLFLALVLVFLAAFVSHRVVLSCCQLAHVSPTFSLPLFKSHPRHHIVAVRFRIVQSNPTDFWNV